MPTLTVVVTPGSASANSYVTTAEAAAYLFAHPDWERWDVLDTVQHGRMVIQATRQIDMLSLAGEKAATGKTSGGAPAQALHFPRPEDTYLGALHIPVPVKNAVCLQALYNLQTGRGVLSSRRQLQMEGVTRIAIGQGDIDETYDTKGINDYSPAAIRMLMDAGLIENTASWLP